MTVFSVNEVIWSDLTSVEKEIVLTHASVARPIEISDLIKISDSSPIQVVRAVESLSAREIIQADTDDGNRYHLNGEIHGHNLSLISESLEETQKRVAKIARFYEETLPDGDQKTLFLAETVVAAPTDKKDLGHIKQAADILIRQKKLEKATHYLDIYLENFARRAPETDQVDDYLDVVLDKLHISRLKIRIEEIIPLLTRAYKIAKKNQKWRHLAKISYRLSRGHVSLGQNDKATRYINEAEIIGKESGERSVKILAALSKCHYLLLKGKIAEAILNYENSISNHDEFGSDNPSLIADGYIGRIYILNGRISRGMGLFEAVLEKATSLNFIDTIIFTNLIQAFSFLDIGDIAEAEVCVSRALEFTACQEDRLMELMANVAMAHIFFARGDYETSYTYHCSVMKSYANSEQYATLVTSWFLEYLYGLESKGYYAAELNFKDEVQKAIKNNNIFFKGVGYRFRAIEKMDNDNTDFAVLADLERSEKWLEKAGAIIELAKTRTALGEYYLDTDDQQSGNAYLQKAWGSFPRVDKAFLPKELTDTIPHGSKVEIMIDQIININDSLKNIKTLSAFLDKVINVSMEFTLATQCLFVKQNQKGDLVTLASRNITVTQIKTKRFREVLKHITKIVKKGEEFVYSQSPSNTAALTKLMSDGGIHSMVFMPVSLGDVTYGYIALMNHLGKHAFPDSVLSYIRLICNQIAIGLANIEMYHEINELKNRFKDEARFYKREMGVTNPIEMIIGKSSAMRDLKEKILQVSDTDSSVLITGETGVGKELVAKEIHNLSKREQGSFIPVNLAALPRELVISELFGYEKGAFTGAQNRQKGRFEIANDGTIFLDEIGDLPADIQVKLLRVLQTGHFERLGSAKSIHSDFRVITATNKALKREVENGSFRQDLYYRLAVFPIHVPPLRERGDDILILAEHFLKIFGRKMGKAIRKVPDSEFRKLNRYRWPGNVRELEHFVERSVILSINGNISFSSLEPSKARENQSDETSIDRSLAEIEREHIEKTLQSTFWKVSGPNGAAEILDLKPTTLLFRMKKLGIEKPIRQRN